MKIKPIITLLAILVILGGCTVNNNELIEENLVTVGGEDRQIIERSEAISDLVVDLHGLDDAATIIFNDIALIGVKVAYDDELTEELKDLITNVVKEYDSSINEIKISDKSKVLMDINKVVLSLLNGDSYDSKVKDIANISNSIN